MELYNFYKNTLGIKNDDIVKELVSISKIKFIHKDVMICKVGEVQKYLYFSIEGIFRSFYYDELGNEITDCFGIECGQPLMASFKFGEKNVVYINSVTNSKIIEIKLSDIIEKLNKYNELYILYNKLVSKSLEIHIKQKEIRYRMNAYERYNWFLKTYPNLDNYIKDKDIASFLGISPITLCRLKNKKYNS